MAAATDPLATALLQLLPTDGSSQILRSVVG